MVSGTLQGSILKSFGRRLAAVWALLGAFLAFLARSGALLGCLFGFMGASDLILGGFGESLRRVLRGSRQGFAKALEDFGRSLVFQVGIPALPRSALRIVTINVERSVHKLN